jgi:Flp pilus assembly protein TadG
MIRPSRPRRARGAKAAVEFAFVAPLLALLLTGVVEMGRAILVRQTLNDTVRKACRTGALPGRSNAQILAEVNDILSDNSIGLTAVVGAQNSSGATVDSSGNAIDTTTTAVVTVSVNGSSFDTSGNMVDAANAKKGDQISVKVSVPFSKVAWIQPIWLGGKTVETETLVMQRQG